MFSSATYYLHHRPVDSTAEGHPQSQYERETKVRRRANFDCYTSTAVSDSLLEQQCEVDDETRTNTRVVTCEHHRNAHSSNNAYTRGAMETALLQLPGDSWTTAEFLNPNLANEICLESVRRQTELACATGLISTPPSIFGLHSNLHPVTSLFANTGGPSWLQNQLFSASQIAARHENAIRMASLLQPDSISLAASNLGGNGAFATNYLGSAGITLDWRTATLTQPYPLQTTNLERERNGVISSSNLANRSKARKRRDKRKAKPRSLTAVSLYTPKDKGRLNDLQILLRHQIEFFQATQDDILSHTRGKNKPIVLQQVGLRCRHCKNIPVGRRQKGSTYFPSNLLGIYQAAQNLSVEHLQSGLCPEVPQQIKQRFASFASTKSAASSAGKKYWADAGRKLGLVDSEDGIQFVADVRRER